MRRTICILLVTVLSLPLAAQAQGSALVQHYNNELLGLAFDYPADWQIQERPAAHMVMAASKDDLDALTAGNAPVGLLFSAAMSSLRAMGISSAADFGSYLQRIVQSGRAPVAVHVGNFDGLSLEISGDAANIASRTVILMVDKSRVAIVRGVASPAAWTASASKLFDQILASLTFSAVAKRPDLPNFAVALWQASTPTLTDMAGIAVSPDGTTIYVTDRRQGIWRIEANSVPGDVEKISGMSAFAQIGILGSGSNTIQFVADPATHAIWQIIQAPDGSKASIFAGGPGSGDGQFGSTAPQYFTFGLHGAIYALDESSDSARIEAFDPTGKWKATWKLSALQPTPVDHGLLSSDNVGNVYLVGRNTGGIYVLDSTGSAKKSGLGKDALQDVTPLALAVDQTGNMFVATAEQGILELDSNGTLINAIGERYAGSAQPKLGQLGKPTALALAQDDRLLYVADSGKFPQVVAFGLNGNHAVNVAAGTVDGGKIAYGQVINGKISSAAFIYVYAFSAKAADSVTITLRASPESDLDPYLELYYQNPGGGQSRLAVSDDARATGLLPTDAQIASFRLRFDGNYTIRATRFGAESGTSTGPFSLSLMLDNAANPVATPDSALTPTQAGIRAGQNNQP